jgi:hypothetical protein
MTSIRSAMHRLLLLLAGATLLSGTAAARELRPGGKLLLTDGVTSVEGAAGGGLATWALIGGRATDAGLGGGGHVTHVRTGDFALTSFGAKLGLFNRVELSWTRQLFDTRAAGAALGLGRGFTFGQNILGAKLRLIGDSVYDAPWLPQIAIGAQHKLADEGAVLRAVGARRRRDTDFFVSATKVVLDRGMVVAATGRLTRANQFGLLGFGGDRRGKRSLQVEASVGKLLSPRVLVGAEYRSKPDNLGFARESDALDLFAAWAVRRQLNVTLAYVDLGDIATVGGQRGVFLSLQGAF